MARQMHWKYHPQIHKQPISTNTRTYVDDNLNQTAPILG